ncbi:MAG TPA: sugar-binding protein, partial [bacterium]|nr:sugar-binding protein [bacterium]
GHSIIIRGDGGAVGSAPAGDLASGAAVKPDGSGWIVEFRQSIAGFAPVIGFDLAINDRDTPGQDNRDGQYRWNGEVDAGWDDETQWGELTLAQVTAGLDPSKWELY